jgi:hypothetical protein
LTTVFIQRTLFSQLGDKLFEVKKYVLPTYAVSISLPDRAPIPDVTFPATIEALYTFGEAVQGEAVVTFYIYEWTWGSYYEEGPIAGPDEVVYYDEVEAMPEPMPVKAKRQAMMMPGRPWGGGQQIKKVLFTKVIQIDSKAVTFDVDIAKDLKISYETTVNAEVVFTEKLTGKTVNAIGSVYIVQFGYEMVITSSDSYQAGTPYNLVISMRKLGSGTPVDILVNLE